MGRARIEGLPELRKALARLGVELDEAAKDAIREGAEAVRDDARAGAPRDTGKTADGIDIVYTTGGLVANVAERDQTRTHVAEFLEDGTASIPARPFMAPAAEHERRQLPKRFETAVAARLEKLK